MTVQELIDAARCFECIPAGMRGAVIISLLDQIAAGGGGGAAQTPWLSHIDGGGFDLFNVNEIDMTGALTIAQGTANASALIASGYSLTGANATNMVNLTGTWNTTGQPTAIFLNITDTASDGNSNLIDLQLGGSSLFRVSKTSARFGVSGSTTFVGAVQLNNVINWIGDTILARAAAGKLTLAGATPMFQLGAADATAPAIKQSTTRLQVRLADDSAFTNIQGILTTDVNAVTGLVAGVLAASTNASIVISDASGQVYRVPCII